MTGTPIVIPFSLPLPPSVNNAYINVRGRGRVKSPYHRAWLAEADVAMLNTPVPTLEGREKWQLVVTYVMPNWRKSDLDNRIKLTVDFLAHYIGLDDNLLLDIHATKIVAGGEAGRVYGRVTIG